MLALMFLQASIASLLAGAGAWLLLHAASRVWPGLAARRTPWLLAVAAVAGSLALGVLPLPSRPSIVPDIVLPAVLEPIPHTQAASAAGQDAAFDDHGAMSIAPAPVLRWVSYAWLAAYLAGLLAAAARWMLARRRLNALLAAAQRLNRADLAAHPGFAGQQHGLPEVREIDAPIAPMLVGLAHPVLLLPRHLRDFDAGQQRLVVEHELTHLARRDPLWMHLSFLLQTMQWFNPMVASLGRQMAWAQELGCDRTVLHGRPAAQRRAYAAALLAQMRMQALPGQGGALAFGGRVVNVVAARIGMIRDGVPAMPRAVTGALGWAALPCILVASLLLQPALAWQLDMPGVVPETPPAPEASPWQAPLEQMRVSAFFGVKHAPTGRLHGGMDFAVPTGTPITAPADGIVVASTNRYLGEDKWGEVVAIEHPGGLRSVYAHMERRLVKEGERVAAGQRIGTSGASGKATGPHLHLEVSRNGENIDPQILLGNLEANATKTARQRLKAARAN
ncbi:M23/M56 family metallopeptidase [Pseudoduganella violaceinigra]|uniref:M23/M56 family metallopeptidase n=1 Tax=Pseudoduganella violaceinigra TaxID=246602 RepID=UPI00040B9728|nr:M23/M56 family metallopeptidase [Pseudoduganella violaceinigra]